MLKTARRLYLVPLLLVALCLSSFGICNLPQPRLVEAEYSQSDAVVIAHMVRSKYVEPKDDLDYHLYTFEVDQTLRGNIPRRFVLYDENSSARLAFDVLRGRKYLLFLGQWAEKGWWLADGCGNSGEISKRAKSLHRIKAIGSMKGARITGDVSSDNVSVANAKVIAVSKINGKRFETVTRAGGSFDLHVPAGEYSVAVTAGGKRFATYFMSYEDAEAVRLKDGGCAQIHFVPGDSPLAVGGPHH